MYPLTAHEVRAIRRHAKLLRRLGASDARIVVVGANEGQTPQAYASELPASRVWAIEPNPELAAQLSERSGDRLTVLQAALGSRAGVVEVQLRVDSRVSSILDVEPELMRRSSHYETVGVVHAELCTLDSLIEGDYGMPGPQLLSIDTQGYDLEVLRGAAHALATGEILIVTSEIHFASAFVGQPQAHEVMAHLAGFGYRLYGFDRLVEATSGALYFGNAMFLSPKAWEELGLL